MTPNDAFTSVLGTLRGAPDSPVWHIASGRTAWLVRLVPPGSSDLGAVVPDGTALAFYRCADDGHEQFVALVNVREMLGAPVLANPVHICDGSGRGMLTPQAARKLQSEVAQAMAGGPR